MNTETEIILEIVTTPQSAGLRQQLRDTYAEDFASLTHSQQCEDVGISLSIVIAEDLMQHPMPAYAARLIVEQFKRVDWKLIGQRILTNAEAN